MPIDFTEERWSMILENYSLFWQGKLCRPLIQAAAPGRDPGRPEPCLPREIFTAFYDLSVPAEDIVDRWDYDLSCLEFIGDAFPHIYPNFGPGVIAALLGADLKRGNGTVWFSPPAIRETAELQFKYDPDNIWLRRIKDIYRAAVDRWEGCVQLGMTDLGGVMDILSAFRPGHRLLLDLYDHPDEVKRLTGEIRDLWWRYFDELNALLQPANPGYTAWAPILSLRPYYMLQCDFSFMIGPDMFREFVLPELQDACRRLNSAFYHLDGPGQLPHVDLLLDLPELMGIQWIPGPDVSDMKNWPELYRHIKEKGKLIQLFGGLDVLETVAGQLGTGTGLILLAREADEVESVKHDLTKYGFRQ